jgi:iron complex transport system substrate-binding protein
MGCGDKIVNQMSPSFTKTDQWKFQYVFAPQIANGPLFEDSSKEIQIETVLETAPDICLCMTKETCTLLEEKGLNVLYLEWKVGSDADKLIRLLGEALGKQELAEDYLTWYNDMVVKADGLTANIAQVDKTTVLYGNVTSLTRPLDIVEWWVSKAGGISVTSDGGAASSAYTIEDLLGWNPEVIVTTNAAGVEQIKADERFKDIPAIVNNQIYKVPTVAHIWGQRTPEQPLTVMWMMNKLHPDILSTEALKEDIRYFYSHFFKTELTDAQLMEIIG